MKKIVFFITHKTLNENNCKLTFLSISNQVFDKKFDKLYIYNTHEDELQNSTILNIINNFEINRFFHEIEIFKYNPNTHKSLGGDIFAISDYMTKTYDKGDRVLLLKSDCLLSKNYFKTLDELPDNKSVYFTAPFICAKRRILDEKILEYTMRDQYVQSDDITFFVEGSFNDIVTDFTSRPSINVTDAQIEFTSCTVIRDFSCHYISVELLNKLNISNQSWGGVNLSNLIPYYIGTDKCFVVHKYHDIISENRPTDREGPVVEWLSS